MPCNEPSPADLFSCTQCGECCKGYGGTYVTDSDIRNIAMYIGSDPETFVADYCQMSGSRPVLRQGENGFCVFFDGLCTIHPVKPRMCRAWPFIPGVLADVQNWHIMAASCPGMRTCFPDSVIRQCVARELRSHGELSGKTTDNPGEPA